MLNRFLSVHKVFVYFCLVTCVFLVSACAPTDVGATPSYLPACPSPVTERNPYYSHPQAISISHIFANSGSSSQLAKQHALLQLGKNIKHWSSYQNISSNNNTLVRIIITYLDPVLVQYIVLNDVLSWQTDKIHATDINQQIGKKLGTIAQRDELLFGVTIVSSSNNGQSLYIDFPIDKLALVNPSNIKTLPTRYDRILAEKIDVTKEPVFGIVSYPVSVKMGENCAGFIDQFTTSLVLDLEAQLTLDNKPYDSLYWNIHYDPLILQDDNYIDPIYDPNYGSRFSGIEMPPTPYISSAGSNDINSTYYWEEMGRYYWGVLIGESDH